MSIEHKAVLVGCGGISDSWLSAWRDHYGDRAKVVGLVDLNERAAAAKADKYGLRDAWVGSSLETCLQTTGADLVFNCTIPEAHAGTCLASLEAGCHVLVEKPLAATTTEGKILRDAAAKAGKILAVIQNRRYLPGIVAVKQALAKGVIGPVTALHVDFFLGPHFGGFRESMRHPLLLDMAIHTFDQCRYLAGKDALRVVCHEFNPAGSWFAHGASATALFELGGGVHFSYRGSWCARGFPTSWAGAWRIFGERGTLLWDGEQTIEVERTTGPWDGAAFSEPVEKVLIPPAPLTPAQQGHAGNIGEFLDAVDGGDRPQTEASDNLKSLAMMEAAIESAQSGRMISLISGTR